jgi:hypothetical protein
MDSVLIIGENVVSTSKRNLLEKEPTQGNSNRFDQTAVSSQRLEY